MSYEDSLTVFLATNLTSHPPSHHLYSGYIAMVANKWCRVVKVTQTTVPPTLSRVIIVIWDLPFYLCPVSDWTPATIEPAEVWLQCELQLSGCHTFLRAGAKAPIECPLICLVTLTFSLHVVGDGVRLLINNNESSMNLPMQAPFSYFLVQSRGHMPKSVSVQHVVLTCAQCWALYSCAVLQNKCQYH